MSLDEFCARIDDAKSLEQLWDVAMGAFGAYGLTSASYHHFPPPGAPDEGKFRLYAVGFPDNWVREYIDRKHYLVDPIFNAAKSSTIPFFWRDRLVAAELPRPERDCIAWQQQNGIDDGLVVQVFGPNGRDGMVMLAFTGPRPDLSITQIRELQAICQLGHMIYIQLMATSPDAVPLTKREREVLEWVAKGKSNSVIGDIMGISTHTVDAYLRRIYLKLGVSDRISASVKGLGLGLVTGIR